MLKQFYPYEFVESVFSIDYEKLYRKGYRGLIFDIDNTLVHHGEDSTREVDALLRTIQGLGFQTLLLSNNDEARVKRFLKNVDSLYICDAQKPKTSNYLKAIEMLKLKKEEVLCIGDQVFTDILGANRSGIACVLVKYLRYENETKIGIRRNVEKVLLCCYQWNRSCQNRLGDITQNGGVTNDDTKHKKLFCEINPACYAISVEKEIWKRHLQNLLRTEKIAAHRKKEKLPNLVSCHHSNIIKRAQGVNLQHQKNKETNIMLACDKMNGLIVHPGETYSFWSLVGRISERKGYKEGRVIQQKKLVSGVGGGLCNLANTIHLLVLHSPLSVTEIHKHSDALAPDEGERFPFSAGTSVAYNYIDYRFQNNTDQDVQLLVWCENEVLYAELRSERKYPFTYSIVEEGHHFKKEGSKYYRISKIYRNTIEEATGEVVEKELIWDNHSEVMYDYDLIPKHAIQRD